MDDEHYVLYGIHIMVIDNHVFLSSTSIKEDPMKEFYTCRGT